MILEYKNKKKIDTIIKETKDARLSGSISLDTNLLIKGNNLSILKALLDNFSEKIDLIYIDPPFSTNNTFRIGQNRVSTISNSRNSEVAYTDILKEDEYLEFIRKRLVFLRELLSDEGSIYVHIDYKIGHYIKILLDEIFGQQNFRGDISRIKCNPKNFKRKGYGNIKDMILFYSKTENYIWNEPSAKKSEEQIKRLFKKIDKNGKRYTTNPLHAPGETNNGKSGKQWRGMNPPEGRHWRYSPEVLDKLDADGLIEWSKNGVPRKIIYAEENGKARMQDIWEFKDSQKPTYPTEKNHEMLNLIINTSSNENSIVLDSFCGSGSALLAAAELGRKWIGIDISEKAIEVCKRRFDSAEPILFPDFFTYQYLEEIERD